MTDLCFVDSNVLVYSRDATEREKQPQAQAWREALWKTRAGCLSAQVLHEFYQVVTRKLSPGMPREQARLEIRDLLRWQVVPWAPALLDETWHLEERFGLAFWDALIVAAARIADCRYLLSEDLTHGADFDGVQVISPFRVAPAEVFG
ncbi:MAG: PIN domain-containing protein [Myxococcota bacterium]